MNAHHPYHPIIYVRGFAMLQSEIEETCADPYMGFNIGSTKTRVVWTGETRKFFFESPVLRLTREGPGYDDVYLEGDDLVMTKDSKHPVPYQCIVIYRYYDEASQAFGSGETPPIEHFAQGLSELILSLRAKVCANPANNVKPEDFRVHLVGHSMGGLVCRAFLQNRKLGSDEARRAVDKLFTYATPHRGIDMRIVRNVPAWLSFGDANNFNRERMAKYLALKKDDDAALVAHFPADRVFNLVGTNPADYTVLRGLSSWAAGDASDGLVRLENAVTHGQDAKGRTVDSPAAYVHRCHSGHYGIVNSEEGYQNLVRFLFGQLRVDGILDVDSITLPEAVQKAYDAGKEVRASYQFEVTVSVRGYQWQLHRRTARENSAIFRTYDELFPRTNGARQPDRTRSPRLFSLFLDPRKSMRKGTKEVGPSAFAIELKVLVPDYVVDGALFLDQHYEGGYIFHAQYVIEAVPDKNAPGGWRLKYGIQDRTPNAAPHTAKSQALEDDAIAFEVPVQQPRRPGIDGRLRIELRRWNEA